MQFEMNAGIRFNRAIDVNKDYISPGGFSMIMRGTTIEFDFSQYSANVDQKDKCLVHVSFKYPDEEEFPDVKQITKDMLNDISKITEFFVYTGEAKETDLQAISLEYVSFVLTTEKWEKIYVKQKVVREAICTGCL